MRPQLREDDPAVRPEEHGLDDPHQSQHRRRSFPQHLRTILDYLPMDLKMTTIGCSGACSPLNCREDATLVIGNAGFRTLRTAPCKTRMHLAAYNRWRSWTDRACAHRPVGDHYSAGAEQTLHEVLQFDMRMVPIEDDAESVAELRAERRNEHAVANSRVPLQQPSAHRSRRSQIISRA